MKVYFRNETTSTMDWARECVAQSGVAEPFVVMSRVQTAGRGRGGSAWIQGAARAGGAEESHAEQSMHSSLAEAVSAHACFGPCTFVLPASMLQVPLTWMSLAVGCALSDAIQAVRRRLENQLDFSKLFPGKNVFEPRIKWPNDVWAWPSTGHASEHIRGRKLAGVLCESSFRGDALQYVTVGIGLNTLSTPESVFHAGSLLDLWGITGKALSSAQVRQLETLLAEEIESELKEYLGVQRTAEQLQSLVLERSLPRGTHMSVNKGELSGAFVGISPEGGLLLEGHDAPVLAGDVALPHFEHSQSGSPIAASGRASARLCLDFGNSHIHWRCEAGAGLLQDSVAWNFVDKKSLQDARVFARLEFTRSIVEHLKQSTQVELVWSAVSHAGMTAKVIAAIENLLVENFPGREIALHPLHADEILQASALAADYAPDQMGVDRALQAWVAAREARASASAVAVISSGTALTGLVVSATGRILESFILPGAALSLAALHEKTARLPSLSLPPSLPSKREEPPFNTQQSMLRGLTLQYLGLLSTLVHVHDVRTVVLTGGGSETLFELLEKECPVALQMEKDLVLRAMSDFVESQSQSRFRLMADEGEGETGLPEKVLQSMLRARLSKRRSQRVALDAGHFRRLGGRLEHVGVGLRIDRHLGEKFKFHTRDIWRERIDIGEVMIEQNSPKNHLSDAAPSILINIKSTYVLKQGDQVWLFHPPEYEPDMATHVEVVHDDGDAAVFCKPGNLVVHAAGLYGKNTFIEIAKKMGYGDAAPVHRIDRETSGLLVCARSTPLRRELSLSFRDASVKKMYLAVTRGQREVPEKFRVNFPIGNAVNSRIRLKLWHNPQEGLDALTHCVRLACWEDYTLFACLPQTGRTNQIRVHLAAIGHWIVGDKMYHPNEEVFLKFYEEGYTDFVAEHVLLPRHWLHNTGIQFLGKPESPLGHAPVIAPLTDDLLVHNPTLQLLKTAGFSREFQLQKTEFAKLFADLLLLDFSSTEIVAPEA